MMNYWGYGTGYMNPGFNILGFLFQVFFWGLVIMLVFKLFKGHGHQHCCEHEMMEGEDVTDQSLQIVRERYAAGEIDKKEFDQLIKDLS